VASPNASLIQGTLDLLVLKALTLGELHGVGVANRVQQISRGAFRVTPGSLFPALHRLEAEGWLTARWGRSENNRRARFYKLTRAGHAKLARETGEWQRIMVGMQAALEAT
jgi:PadR family transcriptional regulator